MRVASRELCIVVGADCFLNSLEGGPSLLDNFLTADELERMLHRLTNCSYLPQRMQVSWNVSKEAESLAFCNSALWAFATMLTIVALKVWTRKCEN